MISLLLAVIYLSFITLGIPDGLLGSAWPTIYPELALPTSYMGILTVIIAGGTVISSLLSDRLTIKLGAGMLTALSGVITGISLLGFSLSNSFISLCLWSVPYGLGAGSVDAALNNYVALHFESRHMSWLHCMWGVGATVGPYVMGYALTGGFGWRTGYRWGFFIQIALTAVVFLSLPLWNKKTGMEQLEIDDKSERRPLALSEIIKIPGTKELFAAFFSYSVVEQTTCIWAGTYLVLVRNIAPEVAASFAAFTYLGITVGRAINGFLSMRFRDKQLIFSGFFIVLVGVIIMMLPFGNGLSLLSFIIVGMGLAPIYPCIIHSTPAHFGAERSQAIIGVQMAAAYMGTVLMPPLFGVLARFLSQALLPYYLFLFLAIMWIMYYRLEKIAPCA